MLERLKYHEDSLTVCLNNEMIAWFVPMCSRKCGWKHIDVLKTRLVGAVFGCGVNASGSITAKKAHSPGI